MDINWQNDIVDQLIKKEPNSTVKDYIIVLNEIVKVEYATILASYTSKEITDYGVRLTKNYRESIREIVC